MKIKKRPFAIALIAAGILLSVMAYNKHFNKKKLIDLGNMEIKKEPDAPLEKMTVYYIVSAIILTIAGGVLLIDKKKIAT